MKDYEILLYIKRFKDPTGKRAFRASADFREYKTDDGKTIKIPCSFYRTQKTSEESEEIVEIRAADHGTVLRTWNHFLHPNPWKNRYNLDIEFLNDPTPQNDLDGNTQFFVVDQWLYENATITSEDVNTILTTIITLGENDYQDPTGKAVSHIVLTPNDIKGRDITDRSNVHPHQLEVLKKYEEEKAAEEMEKNKTNESRVVKLKESDLRIMVKECIRRVLEESVNKGIKVYKKKVVDNKGGTWPDTMSDQDIEVQNDFFRKHRVTDDSQILQASLDCLNRELHS